MPTEGSHDASKGDAHPSIRTMLNEHMPPRRPADQGVEHGIGRVAIGDIVRRSAARYPTRIALSDPRESATFAELESRSNQFANYLLSLNLATGARIATIGANSLDLLTAILGIHKSGYVWVPVNNNLAQEEAAYVLRHAEVSVAVVDTALTSHGALGQVLDTLTKHVIPLGYGNPSDFRSIANGFPTTEPVVHIHERDLAMIMYTSGTTSRPKGVMHCHLAVYFAALGNIGEWSITPNDKLYITLPLFHCAAHIMLLTFIAAGASVVLRSAFDATDMVRSIAHERATIAIGLPMMYAAVLDHPERARLDLSSLRLCIYVMAPMSRTLLPKLISDLCPNFALTMGQTEMYPMTMMFKPHLQLTKSGHYWGESAGINDTALMDEEGNLLAQGEVGEVVHRGPNVMLGYYKDDTATASAQRFGWHHTGDVATFDSDGQLLFLDRKKDMIKSGGENVSSVLVEEVIFRHPAVLNVAVVGLPHPRWGEAIAAFVMLKPDADATIEHIQSHCRQHLAGFQTPKAVFVVGQLPMTGSGKVRKADLRESHKDHFTGPPD